MVQLNVNGRAVSVDSDPATPLLWALREHLNLTGTKFGCGVAACGACTVHVNGQPTRACVTPIVGGGGRAESRRSRRSMPIASAALSRKPGSVTTSCNAATASPARSWRRRPCSRSKRNPSDQDIDGAMAGNICRCGTYQRIRVAIKDAGKVAGLREERPCIC